MDSQLVKLAYNYVSSIQNAHVLNVLFVPHLLYLSSRGSVQMVNYMPFWIIYSCYYEVIVCDYVLWCCI